MTHLRVLLAVFAASAATLSACIIGFDSGPREGDPDAEVPRGGSPPSAPSTDGGAPETVTVFAFDDERHWEARPLSGTFAGAAFDGRYVYFVPRGHATLWRYDTSSAFDQASAWGSVVLPGTDAATTGGFVGAAFSAGYVYLAPARSTAAALRYDVKAPFVTSSWQRGPTVGKLTPAGGFVGVVPYRGEICFIVAEWPGLACYDPLGPFDDDASWSIAGLASDAGTGFAGAVSTDAGLYLVPNGSSLSLVEEPGATPTSGPAIEGRFIGGTTDGQTIYFAPAHVPRALTFEVGDSLFSKKLGLGFDLDLFAQCPLDCFAGAVFDGRFVYLVPRNQARFVRYDTQSTLGFGDPVSWKVGQFDAGATAFYGGAFDGRYVYFVPDGAERVVRFHAREPAAMPSTYSGSFL